MKNREYYYDEIMNTDKMNFCETFIKPIMLNRHLAINCEEIYCSWCYARLAIWLEEEYEEPKKPEVDWNEVFCKIL